MIFEKEQILLSTWLQGEHLSDIKKCNREQFVNKTLYDLLEKGRFACLIIGDKYANSQVYPLGFKCMEKMNEIGFITKSIIVKNIEGNEKAKGRTANLWRYRALSGGFSIFKHEYIMIMQKV